MDLVVVLVECGIEVSHKASTEPYISAMFTCYYWKFLLSLFLLSFEYKSTTIFLSFLYYWESIIVSFHFVVFRLRTSYVVKESKGDLWEFLNVLTITFNIIWISYRATRISITSGYSFSYLIQHFFANVVEIWCGVEETINFLVSESWTVASLWAE